MSVIRFENVYIVWCVEANPYQGFREYIRSTVIWDSRMSVPCNLWRLTLTRDSAVSPEADIPFPGSENISILTILLFSVTVSMIVLIRAWEYKEGILIPSLTCLVRAQENKSWTCISFWLFQDLIFSSSTGCNIISSGPIFACGNGGYHAIQIDTIITELFDEFWKSGFIWGGKNNAGVLCLRYCR